MENVLTLRHNIWYISYFNSGYSLKHIHPHLIIFYCLLEALQIFNCFPANKRTIYKMWGNQNLKFFPCDVYLGTGLWYILVSFTFLFILCESLLLTQKYHLFTPIFFLHLRTVRLQRISTFCRVYVYTPPI